MKGFAELRADEIYRAFCLEDNYFKKNYQPGVVYGLSLAHLFSISSRFLFSCLEYFFPEAFRSALILQTGLQVDGYLLRSFLLLFHKCRLRDGSCERTLPFLSLSAQSIH